MVTTEFSYTQLLVPARLMVQQKTAEIKDRIGRVSTNIIEIGRRLIDVKAALEQGQFCKWLDAEFGWDRRTAERMMQVSEQFKSDTVSHLSAKPSALYLLAAAKTPTKVKRQFKRQILNGQAVTRKEIQDAIDENAEAENDVSTPQYAKLESANNGDVDEDKTTQEPEFPDIPEKLWPIFREAVIFDEILNHLTQISKAFNKLTGGSDGSDHALSCWLEDATAAQEGAKMLKAFRSFITNAKPQNVCVYCKAKADKMKSCNPCRRSGVATHRAWSAATPNMKAAKEGW